MSMSVKTALRNIAVGGSALALGTGLALAGAGSAHAATYPIDTGSLGLTQPSTSFTGPAGANGVQGSWVELPAHGTTGYFPNDPSNSPGTSRTNSGGRYTAIDDSGADGILLGTTTTGGAFSTNTKFDASGTGVAAYPFDFVLTSAAELEFNDAVQDADGFDELVAGANSQLSGAQITYGGQTYDVATDSTSTGGAIVANLTGGYDSTGLQGTPSGLDSYWLQWTTHINNASNPLDPFNNFDATFHLEGIHTP